MREIVEIGQGWKWNIIKDTYQLNDEFFVTRSVVDDMMKNWGRKIENVHLIGVLQKIYRMHK